MSERSACSRLRYAQGLHQVLKMLLLLLFYCWKFLNASQVKTTNVLRQRNTHFLLRLLVCVFRGVRARRNELFYRSAFCRRDVRTPSR